MKELDIFAMLDGAAGVKPVIRKAPFAWTGGKSRTIDWVLSAIPDSETFVDVFGGSGTVMLNKPASGNDVFNDINSGIVSLYRCLRDREELEQLITWIENTIHSYEDWVTCKETWIDTKDDVERAGRWLYMTQYSFSSQGRAYGFSRSKNSFSGKLLKVIPAFGPVHTRFKNVNIENNTWQKMFERYDSPTTVFYLDPPYPDSDMSACYGKNVMEWGEHRQMLEWIQTLKGGVVLSGYENKLYDSYKWSKRFTKETMVSVCKKEHGRTAAEEVIWVK